MNKLISVMQSECIVTSLVWMCPLIQDRPRLTLEPETTVPLTKCHPAPVEMSIATLLVLGHLREVNCKVRFEHDFVMLIFLSQLFFI